MTIDIEQRRRYNPLMTNATQTKETQMTPEQLDAFTDNIARIDEVCQPIIKRQNAIFGLCDMLELAGIEIVLPEEDAA